MDFSFNELEEQYRQNIRQWLDANLKEEWRMYNLKTFQNEEEYESILQKWTKILHDAGLATIAWPKEYGGKEATLVEEIIFNQEMAKAFAPSSINYVGIHMVGPTLMKFGTEEQKKKYIPRIVSGEDIWCQGYSEPNAGSDLTALQTRAKKEDGKWIINGQKVWTSYAHLANYCFLLARTSMTEKKHEGITVFLLDMDQPGVEVVPIYSMDGEHHFNEVYLNDAVATDSQIVGEVDRGWDVLIYLLNQERIGIGAQLFNLKESMDKFVQDVMAVDESLLDDPLVEQELIELHSKINGALINYYRNLSFTLKNGYPGPESSLDKLIVAELYKELGYFIQKVQGLEGVLVEEDAFINHFWQKTILSSYGMTIGGGTSEIHRNTIAERVLGLPKDFR